MKEAESIDMPSARLNKHRRGSSVISKIPDEAESLTVLVGGVNFLKQPITAFVRLSEVGHIPNHMILSHDLTIESKVI